MQEYAVCSFPNNANARARSWEGWTGCRGGADTPDQVVVEVNQLRKVGQYTVEGATEVQPG